MAIEEVGRRIEAIDGVWACRVREASSGAPWSRTVLIALEVQHARMSEASRIAQDALRVLRDAHPGVQAGRLRISWRDEDGVEHRTRPREWVLGSTLEDARRAATDIVFTRAWLDEAVPA